MFQNPPTSEKLIEAILIKTKVKQLDIIATLPKAAPVKKDHWIYFTIPSP